MSKDSYYFKHDSNASSDIKLKAIRRKHGWRGIGWYWFIIEQLRNQDNYQLPYDILSFAGLSSDMDCTPEETQHFIDDCIQFRLFKKGNDHFYSERLNRDMAHLDEIREKTQAAGKASTEKRYGKTEEAKPEPDIAKMITLYGEKTGRLMTPPELDILKDIANTYPSGQFDKAVDEAVNNKAKSPMKYIASVLENWDKEKQSAPKRPKGDQMAGMVEE